MALDQVKTRKTLTAVEDHGGVSQKPTSILSESAGIDGSYWVLSTHSVTDPEIRKQFDHLAEVSIESNPFFKPAFLHAGIENLAQSKVEFLCLFDKSGNESKLKLFAPIEYCSLGIRKKTVLRIWSHEYAPLSTLLLDPVDPDETLRQLTNCLCDANDSVASALLFEHLPNNSRLARFLFLQPSLSQILIRYFLLSRAGINSPKSLSMSTQGLKGKRKQRLRRAEEGLKDLGKLSYQVATQVDTAEPLLNAHLKMEAEGWKGERGTAVIQKPETEQFFRQAVNGSIENGNCTVHSLLIDEKPVATMLMMEDKGAHYPWKIAFDEKYAPYSVGNLLLIRVNSWLDKQTQFEYLDSLADPLNHTANRFWPEKTEFHNMVIGLGKDATKTACQFAGEFRFRNRMKYRAKKILSKLTDS
ncbi:MAG: GNAT family N-acetyltransferase [Pseudomonadota bacterium]